MATIFQLPNGDWRVQIRRKGYPARSETFPTKAQAARWGREIESDMDGRKYLAPTGQTMRQIFERFRDEECPKRKGERWEKVRIKRILADWAWLNKQAEDVDRFDIQEFRDKRRELISDESVRRELALISGIITHAMREWGLALRVNPVHEIQRPPKGKSRRRRVTAAELKALEEKVAFDESKPPRQGYGAVKDSVMWAFHLGIETGMRCGELMALTWPGVHLKEGWVHVGDSKNGDDRHVPLTERAERLLSILQSAAARDKDRVFPVNPGSFEATYRDLCKEAGVSNLHFHDTRHEAASRLSKKLQIQELGKVLGQRDPRTTMVYYNPTPEELVQKLRR